MEERVMHRTMGCFLITAVMLLDWQAPAFSQGSGSSRLSPPRQARPQTPAEFTQSFWKHITEKAPYREWARWPATAEDPIAADEPHGPWVKTYANSVAAKNPTRLGYGSILVNEEYDEDKSTLKAVSVMYCVNGADPDHYDWYWLKYSRDGKVMQTPAGQGGKPIAGKVQSCINCHQKARTELVFSNDEAEAAEGPRSPKEE
jgi:hypothetical protein